MSDWRETFTSMLHYFRRRVHRHAIEKGFWKGTDYPEHAPSEKDVAMKIALIHSEVSEALEELRRRRLEIYRKCTADGTYHPYHSAICSCYKTKEKQKPEGLVVELADAVIRIMDLCEALGLPLEEALILKAEYNDKRPYMHGGKAL